MAQSKSSKRIFNFAYGVGAAIVILGALFKILHWPYGNEMLMFGMITEAIVFFLSAFEPIEEDLDWTKVYPELSSDPLTGEAREANLNETQRMLSQKLDSILQEAKLDAGLITNLSDSIKNFQGAAEGLNAVSETVSSTNQYNEQMAVATAKLESLNNLYLTQTESTSKQTELNTVLLENSQRLQEQMDSLAKNLSSLNGVYGGMLTAMSVNKVN
ncbi:MAG: gliding motility protein GldL [Tenacibaculum sp.]